jgi:calcineurin-like phosphoesterase family protein
MSNSWFTADLHLGHARIIELSKRPFTDLDHMTEAIVDNWNAVVRPNDFVTVLGDVAMGEIAKSLPIMDRLNGQKYLIDGNHDRTHRCYHHKRPGMREHWEQEYLKYFKSIHETDTLLFHLHGKTEAVRLCHLPYHGDHVDGREEKLSPYRPVDSGGLLIHGHVHEAWKTNGRMLNVGVDVWDFRPVHYDEVADVLSGL